MAWTEERRRARTYWACILMGLDLVEDTWSSNQKEIPRSPPSDIYPSHASSQARFTRTKANMVKATGSGADFGSHDTGDGSLLCGLEAYNRRAGGIKLGQEWRRTLERPRR